MGNRIGRGGAPSSRNHFAAQLPELKAVEDRGTRGEDVFVTPLVFYKDWIETFSMSPPMKRHVVLIFFFPRLSTFGIMQRQNVTRVSLSPTVCMRTIGTECDYENAQFCGTHVGGKNKPNKIKGHEQHQTCLLVPFAMDNPGLTSWERMSERSRRKCDYGWPLYDLYTAFN